MSASGSLLQRYALRKFYVIEGPNARDQIAFCAFRLFLVDVKTKLSVYVPYFLCMRKSNLEIRTAGFPCRPQILRVLDICPPELIVT